MTLSPEAARRFLLEYHFLRPPRSLDPETGVLTVLDRLRCIQVDPLDMVGRNPHLVLQARVRGYRPDLLDRVLYNDRELVEAFDKERSIVPADDWALLSAFRDRTRQRYEEQPHPPAGVIDYVRAEIDARAPLSSLDLEDHGTADWRWAPAKAVRAALEIMFEWGEIGICGRTGARKLYDRIDRILSPDQLIGREMTTREYIERRVRSFGLVSRRAGPAWHGLPKEDAATRGAALDSLAADAGVIRIDVDGMRHPLYAPVGARTLLKRAAADDAGPVPPAAAFIAPLDNVIWDRKLIAELFGFEYTWEVYTPATKRRYGYYVLPVLYGDRFVARFEPRRVADALVVRDWWWEPGFRPDDACRDALRDALGDFTRYLEVERVEATGAVGERDRRMLGAVRREEG